jgi:hypothetical protein
MSPSGSSKTIFAFQSSSSKWSFYTFSSSPSSSSYPHVKSARRRRGVVVFSLMYRNEFINRRQVRVQSAGRYCVVAHDVPPLVMRDTCSAVGRRRRRRARLVWRETTFSAARRILFLSRIFAELAAGRDIHTNTQTHTHTHTRGLLTPSSARQ